MLYPRSALDNTEETVVVVTKNWGQEVLGHNYGGQNAAPAGCRGCSQYSQVPLSGSLEVNSSVLYTKLLSDFSTAVFWFSSPTCPFKSAGV